MPGALEAPGIFRWQILSDEGISLAGLRFA
jgi:hypothetical protein